MAIYLFIFVSICMFEGAHEPCTLVKVRKLQKYVVSSQKHK